MKLTLLILSLILMMGSISAVLASSSAKLEEVRGYRHQDDRDDGYQREHEEQGSIKMPGLGR